MPQIRYGQIIVEEISFTKANGSGPQSCEMTTPYAVAVPRGNYFDIRVSGSPWFGRIVDVQQIQDEGGGNTSRIRAVDLRDDLFGKTVFAKINIIDPDGEVYSEIDGENPLNETELVEGKLYAFEIINWLCFTAGFDVHYSAMSQAILDADVGADWSNSRYNVFNIDWSTGIKVGPALDQVCDALGLQFTPLYDGSRLLRFTRRGFADYDIYNWSPGAPSVSSQIGEAVQPDVDTGVWIVGERDVFEHQSVGLTPAWNEAWSEYRLDGLKLIQDLEAHNPPLNALANTVGEFITDLGFYRGTFFNDMTISEYLFKIVGRCFRINGVENLMTEEEFDGTKKPRNEIISGELPSAPSIGARVFGHMIDYETKRPDLLVMDSEDYVLMEGGYDIDERTGHILFDTLRFKLSDAAKASLAANPGTNPTAADYEVDEHYIDIGVYGRLYRQFFGTDQRVGSKTVSGLRRNFVIPGALSTGEVDDVHENAEEYVLPGEKYADWIAEDVAAALLDRPRTVISGETVFKGIAGHEPSGEIQRVTVRVSEGEGIVESVSYANDEPSPEYEPQVELRRKISLDRETKRIDLLKKELERSRYKSTLKSSGGKSGQPNSPKNPGTHVALEAYNRDNYVTAKNSIGEYIAGEPVLATPDSTGAFTVTEANPVDGDPRMIGISITDSQGNLDVVTQGIIPALVIGPVEQGDTLKFDATNWALKAGDGPIVAMQAQASATPTRIPVRIGGASSGRGTINRFLLESVDDDVLNCYAWDAEAEDWGDDLVEVTKPFELQRTPFDGETIAGITYTYSSATEREADDGGETENQLVTPDYVDDVTEILAVNMGTASSPDWWDLNDGARAWAKEPA